MDKILNLLGEAALTFLFKLVIAIAILFFGFKIVNFIVKQLTKRKGYKKIEKTTQSFLTSILSTVLKIFVLIMAITELGISQTSIVTVVGSAGLALGLALQGGLSNLAGGLMIMLFKPFKVGDFIDTHTDSGTVLDINIFNTTLKTYDNKVIVIPNGGLSNSTIVNYSTLNERLLDITVSVSYKNDIDNVKDILKNIIDDCKYKLENKDVLIALKEHADSALIYTVRLYVLNENYWPAKFELLETIKKEFDKNNISIPYPQVDVHLEK